MRVDGIGVLSAKEELNLETRLKNWLPSTMRTFIVEGKEQPEALIILVLACLYLTFELLPFPPRRTLHPQYLTRVSPGSTYPSWASPTPQRAVSRTVAVWGGFRWWMEALGRISQMGVCRWRPLKRGFAAWSRRNRSSTVNCRVMNNLISKENIYLKGLFSQKWKFCHQLLTVTSLFLIRYL